MCFFQIPIIAMLNEPRDLGALLHCRLISVVHLSGRAPSELRPFGRDIEEGTGFSQNGADYAPKLESALQSRNQDLYNSPNGCIFAL